MYNMYIIYSIQWLKKLHLSSAGKVRLRHPLLIAIIVKLCVLCQLKSDSPTRGDRKNPNKTGLILQNALLIQ
jgi:hypothetical protein